MVKSTFSRILLLLLVVFGLALTQKIEASAAVSSNPEKTVTVGDKEEKDADKTAPQPSETDRLIKDEDQAIQEAEETAEKDAEEKNHQEEFVDKEDQAIEEAEQTAQKDAEDKTHQEEFVDKENEAIEEAEEAAEEENAKKETPSDEKETSEFENDLSKEDGELSEEDEKLIEEEASKAIEEESEKEKEKETDLKPPGDLYDFDDDWDAEADEDDGKYFENPLNRVNEAKVSPVFEGYEPGAKLNYMLGEGKDLPDIAKITVKREGESNEPIPEYSEEEKEDEKKEEADVGEKGTKKKKNACEESSVLPEDTDELSAEYEISEETDLEDEKTELAVEQSLVEDGKPVAPKDSETNGTEDNNTDEENANGTLDEENKTVSELDPNSDVLAPSLINSTFFPPLFLFESSQFNFEEQYPALAQLIKAFMKVLPEVSEEEKELIEKDIDIVKGSEKSFHDVFTIEEDSQIEPALEKSFEEVYPEKFDKAAMDKLAEEIKECPKGQVVKIFNSVGKRDNHNIELLNLLFASCGENPKAVFIYSSEIEVKNKPSCEGYRCHNSNALQMVGRKLLRKNFVKQVQKFPAKQE